MTTIFNIADLVDHRRQPPSIDFQGDLQKIFKDTSSAINDIEFQDCERTFEKQRDYAERELGELLDFAKGTTLDDYISYVSNLERLVETMAGNIITVTQKLDRMEKDILGGKVYNRDKMSDFLTTLKDDATEQLGMSCSLNYTLESRGWSNQHRNYLFKILNGNKSLYLDIIARNSSASDIIVGVDNWLYVFDKTVHIVNGSDDIKLEVKNGDLEIRTYIKGKTSTFKLHDMKDMFMDLLNPTDEEILMYEMASHKTYDINAWCEIFGTKPK